MNIASAKEQIRDTVEAYLAKDEMGLHRLPVARQRPVLLMGAPGIGKTAIMEQVARELGIGLVAYSMTHHTRQSALGLPRIAHEEFEGIEYDASEYTMSEIVASIYDYMKKTGLRQGILFLDEINCVSETLYPSMLQFLQFKTFGRHHVPDDWIIVCAGNPPEYNRAVHTFDIVTLDRLREIEVEPDYAAWKSYASQRELHPAVTTFLEAKNDCFYRVQSKPGGEKSFVTARGWEDLAETIALYEDMGKKVDETLIAQFLRDDEISDAFATYYELFQKYRSDYQVSTILDGTVSKHIVERARKAKFDERVALMGLMLDMLGTSCGNALAQESVATALRDDLREVKPALMDGANVDEVLLPLIARREDALARRQRSGTLDVQTAREQAMIVGLLKDFVTQCRMAGTTAGPEAFNVISGEYRAEVERLQQLVQTAQEQMGHAFDFIDQVFGSKREVLVFMAELTTRKSSTLFIAHYGNDAYYAHNDDMQVDSNAADLSRRIAELRLDVASGSGANRAIAHRSGIDDQGVDGDVDAAATQPADDGVLTMEQVQAYYQGKQFEYGFASMSRMNLPANLTGKTVLDVCCRRGKGVYKLSSHVGREGHVIGIDWSESFIDDALAGMDRAWRDNGLKKNNMEFYVAYPEDLSQAGLGTSTIDVVYINNVATLLAAPSMAFAEFWRVLRPGGMLVCETIVSDRSRTDWVVKAARGIGNSVQAAQPLSQLSQMLADVGFVDFELVDELPVDADTGFMPGRTVETVSGDEDVTFTAVCVHARKPLQ